MKHTSSGVWCLNYSVAEKVNTADLENPEYETQQEHGNNMLWLGLTMTSLLDIYFPRHFAIFEREDEIS